MKYLPEQEILPHIHMARLYDTAAAGVTHRTVSRTLDCYELGYYLTDGGTLFINGTMFSIKKGDMRFMKPEDTISSEPDYRCFTIFFYLGDPDDQYHNELTDNIPKYFHGGSSMEEQMKQVTELFVSPEPGTVMMQNGLLMQILYQCYQKSRLDSHYCEAVQQCIAYMREHMEQNITLETLGQISGYSSIHIRRLFCRDTMFSPHEYLERMRMEHAKRLLENSDILVSQIAGDCGYSSESHFQMLFKKVNGCTPGFYRQLSRKT